MARLDLAGIHRGGAAEQIGPVCDNQLFADSSADEAKARGKVLGRQTGQRPKSDRLAPKVMALVVEGRSYRWIARDLGMSKNTVAEIVNREQGT
ncbi:MAG: Resolvase [uncultured Caballeronia sp.]|nr:MAG: Resolvase [uncultured Caballeronia sp.]